MCIRDRGEIEYRYWLCQRFSGHFLGVHVLGSQYNIAQQDLPLIFGKGSKESVSYTHLKKKNYQLAKQIIDDYQDRYEIINRVTRHVSENTGPVSYTHLDVYKRQGQTYSRDWSLAATGTRITAEFGAFLKELLR